MYKLKHIEITNLALHIQYNKADDSSTMLKRPLLIALLMSGHPQLVTAILQLSPFSIQDIIHEVVTF